MAKMKRWISLSWGLATLCTLLRAVPSESQLVRGTMEVRWDEGAADCAKSSQSRLQLHSYNPQTFILRENLCATFEAPFMYLLVGQTKAMLIDTGDIADSRALVDTVMNLLPVTGGVKLPLLVVHTHRHFDHRLGDAQFAKVANVQVVGFDLDSVKRYYAFSDWPNGAAQIDLGDRTVDVIPTPGHNETEMSFYDRNTGLLFTGDFLMPARLLIDDAKADLASADRIAAFVKDRPVSYVLGGHIEMDATGKLFPWQSQYHPGEHGLAMTKADVMALPDVIRRFNGFYSETGGFVLMNSMRILLAMAMGVGVLLIAFVIVVVRYIRRRRIMARPV